MENIPSAEDFLWQHTYSSKLEPHKVVEVLKLFAAAHVEAALKVAAEKGRADDYPHTHFVNKESILNAYPLDKIV